MRRAGFLAVVALALVCVAGGSAYAQNIATVTTTFPFVVDNKVMPAGTYEFMVNTDPATDEGIITVVPPKGTPLAMPVITRLAQHGVNTDMKVVFDKVGDKYVVSELWFPTEDGFLVKNTKEKHTHEIVKGEKKVKKT